MLTLKHGAAERIAKAQAEARKSAPAGTAEHAGAAGAIGAAIREILAAVDAELGQHLALLEDLQDRIAALELRLDQLESRP